MAIARGIQLPEEPKNIICIIFHSKFRRNKTHTLRRREWRGVVGHSLGERKTGDGTNA